MTSKTNAKPPMSNAKPSGSPNPPVNNPYSPSVPISLYREVTNELQTTKTQADSLKLQNQELVQQNQQLRLEIERVVQTALKLRQVADSFSSGKLATADAPQPEVEIHFEHPPTPVASPVSTKSIEAEAPEFPTPPLKKKLVTEQQPPQPRRKIQSDRPSEISGWWLVLTIIVIVVTAFGTGFLIVRPLLPSK
ncbi:hypothetical protein K9N68_15985 [Kovacikia minuta CCNUW1]|uniref:hypothetical protein n=1 Tax=Kovacikia minuta TaxID=2931930 RepID=UPI001CC9B45A|nr:hypothetical protein [Kovacikia minuta]UBF29199.1 hypothetical protein K9N68_15985 [Kovacikia minuta CCNUW1]